MVLLTIVSIGNSQHDSVYINIYSEFNYVYVSI